MGGATCDYRIAQEGAISTVPFIQARRVHPARPDLELLLQSDDLDKPPEIEAMTEGFQKELATITTGSVAFIYSEPDTDLTVEGVEGKCLCAGLRTEERQAALPSFDWGGYE